MGLGIVEVVVVVVVVVDVVVDLVAVFVVAAVVVAAMHSSLQDVMQVPSSQYILTAQSWEDVGECRVSPSSFVSTVRFLMDPGAAVNQGFEA